MYQIITNLKYNGATYKPDALVDLPEEIGKGLVADGVVSFVKPEKSEKTEEPKKVKSVKPSKKRKY